MLLLDLEKRLQFTAVPVREWLGEAIHHPQFQHLSFVKDVLQLLSTTDLETAWQTAAENVQGLSAEDTAALKRLGTQLGKSDTQTQVHCIREAVADVVANKTKAMQLAEKARKLYVGLGTCAGMAIGLLLV